VHLVFSPFISFYKCVVIKYLLIKNQVLFAHFLL